MPGTRPTRGEGKNSPRPLASSEPASPVELAGRWARAALEGLVSPADPDPSVLLVGEPGTGKRHLARAFHDRRHRGGAAPFEIVRPTAGGDDDEIYAAVFGREGRLPGVRGGLYWPGAIELARGGTAVLERLDRFPERVARALAAYLEEGLLRPLGGDARRPAPCALVVTVSSWGKSTRKSGPVRDLARRFDVVLNVPPLRERTGDVEDLFRYFAKRIGFGGFPARAAKHFAALPWPGNTPELREKVEAEAAYWLESCASPGRSRADVEREIRRCWEPRAVPAGAEAAPKAAPGRRAGGTKKELILSLAEQVAKGGLGLEDAARRATASVSYTKRVLRAAGIDFPKGKGT